MQATGPCHLCQLALPAYCVSCRQCCVQLGLTKQTDLGSEVPCLDLRGLERHVLHLCLDAEFAVCGSCSLSPWLCPGRPRGCLGSASQGRLFREHFGYAFQKHLSYAQIFPWHFPATFLSPRFSLEICCRLPLNHLIL